MNQEEVMEKSIQAARDDLNRAFILFCVLGHVLNDNIDNLLGFDAKLFCQVAFYITCVSSYIMPAPMFFEKAKETNAFTRASFSLMFFYGAMILLLSRFFQTNFAAPVGVLNLFCSLCVFYKTHPEEKKRDKNRIIK